MPYEANINNKSKRQVTGGGLTINSNSNKTKIARSSSATTSVGSNKRIRKAGEESSSTNDSHDVQQQQQQELEGWRVKLYRLNADGTWDDCGTGRITCLYSDPSSRSAENNNSKNTLAQQQQQQQQQHPDQWLYAETGEATLCVTAESSTSKYGSSASATASAAPKILLRTRILLRDAYQRQGDNIITWCEPCYTNNNGNDKNSNTNNDDEEDEDDNNASVDLALSFQDNAGCLEIWRHITDVQSRAAALLRPVEDMAAQAAAQHHASLLLQHRQELSSSSSLSNSSSVDDMLLFENTRNSSASGMNNNNNSSSSNCNHEEVAAAMLHEITEQMPAPPTLETLDDIADIIATLQHVQQRDSLATFMITSDCLYLKQLLALFPIAEEQRDYEKLATLAACVKTILLLNDPSILELMITEPEIFEQVCSCLEYDPDLREKANHRWFLRERAKFRTVIPMEDPDLVASIHRCFRVQYLRDTLLRPTMDESSLSTLSSLQTFIYGDVIKGVTYSSSSSMNLKDSYLVRVIRMLGIELHSLNNLDWSEMEASCSNLPILDMTEITKTNASTAASTDGENYSNTAVVEPRRTNISNMNKPTIPIFQRPTITADDLHPDPSTVFETAAHAMGRITSGTWKQYLAPQDGSVSSRRLRRRGCLSFLRELFNMVRLSLQQNEKDSFFSILCTLEIDLKDDPELFPDNISQTSQQVEVGSVASTVRSDRLDNSSCFLENALASSSQQGILIENTTMIPLCTTLLSLLGNVLSDPFFDITEKGFALEILFGVALHDPAIIRQHCLESHFAWKKERSSAINHFGTVRPEPNERKQVIYVCPPNDVLASLLFLLDVETDSGVLLQVLEILKIIMDSDMAIDHGAPLSPGGFDEEGFLSTGQSPAFHTHQEQQQQQPQPQRPVTQQEQQNRPSGDCVSTSTIQKRFLSVFYEHYVEWLVAPFQFTLLYPARRVPDNILRSPSDSSLLQKCLATFQKGGGVRPDDPWLRTATPCAVRISFAVELLGFCVRVHQNHMKFYLLKSRVLSNVMDLLRPRNPQYQSIPGDRCLKLAVLRLLRAIVSFNDELYNRHIIQHNLFAPVFEAFSDNPVGDNLVSSAIVEMCDFILTEKITSLMEYIVTRFLSGQENGGPSLEDVSSPYVSTLTSLRQAYDDNLARQKKNEGEDYEKMSGECEGSRYFLGNNTMNHSRLRRLSGQALEDQRKFREVDEEQSYFEMDEGDEEMVNSSNSQPTVPAPPSLLSNSARRVESELHRTPRMFSLTDAPSMNSIEEERTEKHITDNESSAPGTCGKTSGCGDRDDLV